MKTVTKSIKTQEDEYTFPNEESVKRFEEEVKPKKDEYTYSMEELDAYPEKTYPWDEKMDRYLKWMIADIKAGYPSKTEGIPEEFKCYRKEFRCRRTK